MAAALLNATIDQPGWREGRKFAGRAYAEATAPIMPWAMSTAWQPTALLNRENACAVSDSAIAALSAIRSDIDAAGSGSLCREA